MQIILNFFVFIFGLIIGSFLNCVIYRLEKEVPTANPSRILDKIGKKLTDRSYCLHCKHTLNWLDLIPIVSFLLLRARCRYCHKKISVQYPLVEILTGLTFLLISNFEFRISNNIELFSTINLIFLFYISSVLIVIFVYDLKHYIIPDKILFPAILVTFLYQLIFQSEFLIFNSLWAGLGAFIIFALIFLFSGGKWMGFGDCKLVILLGLLLGYKFILLGLFLSFFFGAIIGVALMILSKKGLKSQIQFAPFLITGTFIAIFWGEEIINWYRHLFLF